MLKSMTGFGQAESKSRRGHTRVEIKATNHKFFEVSLRLPGHLAEFEETLRKRVAQELRRGKIFLFVSSPDPASFSSRLVLNEALAKEAFQKITRLRKILRLSRAVSEEALLREVLRTPDVLGKETESVRRTQAADDLIKTLSAALKNLNGSKISEGRALARDFRVRIAEIGRSLKGIEKRIPLGAKEYRKSLERRMNEFLKNGELDHERLTVEVAQYVKNSDISEEVTRLKSHIAALGKTLGENAEVGKKMDFIAQEMLRETNTMGAKSQDTAIAHSVIQLKGAIEKIREQAQNVE